MVAIDVSPLALTIGTVIPTNAHTFIPGQTKPGKRIKDLLLRFWRATLLVGIFNAQQKFTAMLLRKAPVKQRNVGRPNMWVTGGRRSNTGFHGWHN